MQYKYTPSTCEVAPAPLPVSRSHVRLATMVRIQVASYDPNPTVHAGHWGPSSIGQQHHFHNQWSFFFFLRHWARKLIFPLEVELSVAKLNSIPFLGGTLKVA